MSLEIFARQSVAAFMHIYAEIYDGTAIEPEKLEAIMWGRLCAKEAGISRMSIKVPYESIRRSKVTLPYMPEHINYTGCPVIKKNGGLYTPCCGKVPEDAFYCKTCTVDKDGNAKELEFGTLDTREENIDGDEFAPSTYAEWMKAHKTTLPEVYAKLAAQGIQLEIPAEELISRTLPKARRGRKSKPDDESADADTVKPKRKAKTPEPDSSSSEDEAKPVPKKPAAKPTHKSPVASPVASPEASDSSSSEDEAKPVPKAAPKASPKASPVASPAASDSEKPKAKPAPKKSAVSPVTSDSESSKKKTGPAVRPAKAEKPKVEKPKVEKAEKPKAEKAEKPKAEKVEKAEKAKAEKPKKEKKEVKVEPTVEQLAEEEAEEFEQEFEQEDGDKEIEIDGKDYIKRGEVIFTMDGRIVAAVAVDEDGEEYPDWTGEER